MKKGQIFEGTVIGLEFPNKAKVKCEDTVVQVKNALPGQKIRFSVAKKRGGKVTGNLMEVIEKSELEDVTPDCPHFGACGGCSYQTMSYGNQKKLKCDMVKNILDKVIGGEYDFEGIIGSPVCREYRNKMEFSFGDEYKDGPLALGMHRKNSFYDIVTVDSCKLIHNDYRVILRNVLDYFSEKEITYFHKVRHDGYLRHLLIRRSYNTGEILVVLVTTSDAESEKKAALNELTEKLLSLKLEAKICGFVHIINDSVADAIRCDEMRTLYGRDYIYEELLGLKFKISVFSFFQTNTLGAEVLYTKAREYIGDTKDKLIFDLYSGTGTIAQIVADVAKKVIGVEIVEEAVNAARENAKENGLDNCEFHAGDVLKCIDEIKQKPDLIIVDPPRDGINPKALEKIIAFGVERMVYVSCNPVTLGRDLEVLLERGYRVKKACAIDQFPETNHCEVCCLLEQKKSAKEHIEITVDAEDYYRIKDSEKKTEE